ncbi:YihY/virulence factor BrkB family protein [Bacteroidales bacterium OttesenSCG-928-A17]|nr:YihY/virulence factor BrkB family protein [Bacteroidales bacterium OttesenSCG-928-A17]
MNFKSIPENIKKLWFFISEDMWRVVPSEISKEKQRGYNVIKIITLAIKRYQEDHLQRSASALTYSTFLSVIPLLAVILAIAKGFGFENIVESQLFEYFPGPKNILEKGFDMVDSYMAHTKDGVFLGIGLVVLFYTVFNLISSIENIFNIIWQVPKGRSVFRRFTDYFSVFLLLPILLVCSSGVSILLATTFETVKEYVFLAPIYEVIIAVTPVVIAIFIFTALYMYMPNTKVRFKHAFIAAIFAGIAFQAFQYLYISGQIWVSKYNAIYGSFAFIPLLLLWIQLSWVICLIGAEIAYAGQNVQNYEFEQDSKNISRRYLDFLTLSILTLIVKRFETEEKPYTTSDISNKHKIPIRLTQSILYNLVDLGIIIEIKDKDTFTTYQPAVDINMITIAYLFTKIDRYGSENFKVDNKKEFSEEWEAILESRKDMFPEDKNILLKDLNIHSL